MTSPVWTPARCAMDFARDLMGFEANGRKIFQLKLEMERIRLGALPQPTKLIKINYRLGTAMILS